MSKVRKLAIIDIDVTLADPAHREHLIPDWQAFVHPDVVQHDTPVDLAFQGIHKLLRVGFDIVFLTGRNQGLAEVTQKWLTKHMGVWTHLQGFKGIGYELIMRPEGNQDTPSAYKRQALAQLLGPYAWDVVLALDDDKYMWEVYEEFGCIPMKAPECWAVLFPEAADLPPEQAWRK